MNKTFQEAEELLAEISEGLESCELQNTDVILCVPAPYLELAADFCDGSKFMAGAQNIHDQDFGAYTGEVSAPMLKSLNVDFTIIGHSERRKYFGESGDFLKKKVEASLKHGIGPIFCCGEVLDERNQGIHFEVVKKQLEETVFLFPADEFRQIIIAYEPVWAIGTGVNATPAQAQEMHAAIRRWIEGKFGEEVSESTIILYGGSCNAGNAAELFRQPDVDGGLIGGASLKASEFLTIVKAAEK